MRGSKIPQTNDKDKYSKQRTGAQVGIYKEWTKQEPEEGVQRSIGIIARCLGYRIKIGWTWNKGKIQSTLDF